MEPDGIHSRVARELGEVTLRPFSVIYQWYWKSAEIPVSWKLADVIQTSKRAREKILVIIGLTVFGAW